MLIKQKLIASVLLAMTMSATASAEVFDNSQIWDGTPRIDSATESIKPSNKNSPPTSNANSNPILIGNPMGFDMSGSEYGLVSSANNGLRTVNLNQAGALIQSGMVSSIKVQAEDPPSATLNTNLNISLSVSLLLQSDLDDLKAMASEKKIPVQIEDHKKSNATSQEEAKVSWVMLWPMMLLLPWIGWAVWYFKFSAAKVEASGDGAQSDSKTSDQSKSKPPSVTFKDVAGQESAKDALQEIVDFLKNPERFKSMGAKPPKGVLLEGDPGNGKTLLAKAVAGEAGVPFFSASGSEFVEVYVGVGAKRVRELFAKARKHKTAIVFIDEIDVVGRRRSTSPNGGDGEHAQTINQLLTEMDGFDTKDSDSTIIVIGATNRADILDPALVRPGRIDRRVFVPLPDVKDREAVLSVHAKTIKLSDDVNLGEIAKSTPGFSGADLAGLLNQAALLAARSKGMTETNMECIRLVTERVMLGDKRPIAAMSEEERRVVAYHEAGHALVAVKTPGADPVRRATIIPRGRALGAVLQTPDNDRHLWKRSQLLGRLTVAMGGRAAEELIFDEDDVTSGASGDITYATNLAREMAGRYGLIEEIGTVDLLGEGNGNIISQATREKLDMIVRNEIRSAKDRAREILESNIDALHALANRLLKEESLDGEEVYATINNSTPRQAVKAALEYGVA